MNTNSLEKLIIEHLEESKKIRKRLEQEEKNFEENSRRIREEIERNRNRFPKD